MQILENRDFERLYDDGGTLFHGLTFRKCRFITCWLSMTLDPTLRFRVSDVHLQGCELRASGCGAAILQDVTVDGLKTHGLFQCFGAVFKHVVFRGRIERLMLSTAVQPGRGQ
jgi:hypothetical protein